MSRGGLLGSITRFDKASMKHTADLVNRRDPKTLLMLAAEAVAFNIHKIKLNLNHDQLWVVFKVLSRGNQMEDLILKRMVEESEARFYDIEEYTIIWNQKVKLKGLGYLLQLFPNLKRIDLTGCTVTDGGSEAYEILFSHPSLVLIKNNVSFVADPGYLTRLCEANNWEPVWIRQQELAYIHRKQ